MRLEDNIRLLLKEEPLTVEELSEKLGVLPETINSFTAFRMLDVYEEDDGKLKLGDVCKGRVCKTQEVQTHIVEIVQRLAGKMSLTKIAEVIEVETGERLSKGMVYGIIQKNGWLERKSRKKWSSEMDAFVLAFHGSHRERAIALNKKFGTNFSECAVQQRFKGLEAI